MGLLQEIITDAIDQNTDIPNLLRKCRILGHRLKYIPLQEWVSYELSGYPVATELPLYRKCAGEPRVAARGYGWLFKDVLFPIQGIPEEYRLRATVIELRKGVAHFVGMPDRGDLKVFWPPALVDVVNSYAGVDPPIVEAYVALAPGFINGMMDAIRNGILGFALGIEDESQEAGDIPSAHPPVAPERLGHIFNITILGGQATIGSTGIFEQIEKQVKANDQESLRRALRQLGVPDDAISELDEILEVTDPQEIEKPRGKLPEWAKMAGEAVRDTTIEVGTTVVTELIKNFAGIS